MAEFLDRYGFFCVMVVVTATIVVWRGRGINVLLSSWASANHVAILSRSRGWFRGGPFFPTLGHQAVYLLTVRDQQGLERNCWIRLGGFFTGLLSNKVEARWEQRDRFEQPSGGPGVT